MRSAILLALLCGIVGQGCDQHRPTVRPQVADEPAVDPHAAPSRAFHGQSPHAAAAAVQGPEVELEAVRLRAPEGWVRKAPRIEFIRAEFTLPRAEGDSADGRLTVSIAGGSIDDNLQRWRQMFGPKPEKESQEKTKVAGMEVTLVDYSGNYQDQQGPMMAAKEAPGYRMLGAVFQSEGKLHFIKAYGPTKTMQAHAEKFRAFVQSMKPKE